MAYIMQHLMASKNYNSNRQVIFKKWVIYIIVTGVIENRCNLYYKNTMAASSVHQWGLTNKNNEAEEKKLRASNLNIG